MDAELRGSGTCFDDAFAMAAWGNWCGDVGWSVCHGIIALGDIGYAHAWVELGGRVLECVVLNGERFLASTDLGEWRRVRSPTHVTRYGAKDFLSRVAASPDFYPGPWNERYLKALRDKLPANTPDREIAVSDIAIKPWRSEMELWELIRSGSKSNKRPYLS